MFSSNRWYCSTEWNVSRSARQKQLIEFSLLSLHLIDRWFIDLWCAARCAGMWAADGPWNRPSTTWWTSTCWLEWLRSWRTSSWSWRRRCRASSREPRSSTGPVPAHCSALQRALSLQTDDLLLFYYRKEVPFEKDHREEAPHQRDDSQAAAVQHLENRERVLRVCPWTVSVRARSRRQGEGRGTLRPGSELLLWKDLSQSQLSVGRATNERRGLHQTSSTLERKGLQREAGEHSLAFCGCQGLTPTVQKITFRCYAGTLQTMSIKCQQEPRQRIDLTKFCQFLIKMQRKWAQSGAPWSITRIAHFVLGARILVYKWENKMTAVNTVMTCSQRVVWTNL